LDLKSSNYPLTYVSPLGERWKWWPPLPTVLDFTTSLWRCACVSICTIFALLPLRKLKNKACDNTEVSCLTYNHAFFNLDEFRGNYEDMREWSDKLLPAPFPHRWHLYISYPLNFCVIDNWHSCVELPLVLNISKKLFFRFI
jgi:hypothetical protein